MELISLEIHGYRRFSEKVKIDFGGKLIAIIGPNESGKSSLLEALSKLSIDDTIVTEGPAIHITRGRAFGQDHNPLIATFCLDDEDRAELASMPGAPNVRWLIVSKRMDGTRSGHVLPQVSTDWPDADAARRAIGASVEALERAGIQSAIMPSLCDSIDAGVGSDQASNLTQLLRDLRPARQSGGPDAPVLDELAAVIQGLLSRRAEVQRQVWEVLKRRLPDFMVFSDSDRELLDSYDMESMFPDKARKAGSVPKALANIVGAASLDLVRLNQARKSDDQGEIETMLLGANNTIKQKLSAWSQSAVAVRLRLNGRILSILVSSDGDHCVRIGERSDGLKQFVALAAFISGARRSKVRPILLIDEVERHLHYDAQADVIQMLTQQELASQVVYSTHSVGALPEDLGTGIRGVRRVDGEDRSDIDNWFWANADNRPGLARLLFGIGANNLAFVPVRSTVLTEGATDFILLPTLLRQASGEKHLGYQIAPGLSQASAQQIAIVDTESPRVLYLLDSDRGGGRLARKVKAAGVSSDRIMRLPTIDGHASSVLEDIVDAEAYKQAVTIELERSHGAGAYTVPINVIDVDYNRPRALSRWCADVGIEEPSKTHIALHLLSMRFERDLVAEKYRESLNRLHGEISARLFGE